MPEQLKLRSAGTRPHKAVKIYQDEIKASYTSHWDWDYLSRDEVGRLAGTRSHQAPLRAKGIPDPQPSTRPFLFGAVGAAAAATISGVLLLAG